jgi:hypothetical protein
MLIIFIIILIYIPCISIDHFENIHSLNIKYNNTDIVDNNDKLKCDSPNELSLSEKINSELSSHPLYFEKQYYSSSRYPFIGKISPNNNESSYYNSFVLPLDKTVFNIKY